MMKPYEDVMICQDCHQIYGYDQKKHETMGSCECGGDLCGCEWCTDLVNSVWLSHCEEMEKFSKYYKFKEEFQHEKEE